MLNPPNKDQEWFTRWEHLTPDQQQEEARKLYEEAKPEDLPEEKVQAALQKLQGQLVELN